MTPTAYTFRKPKNRNLDHYVAYASKQLLNILSGNSNNVVSSYFNSTFENPLNTILIPTLMN